MKTISLICAHCSQPFMRRLAEHKHLTEKRGIATAFCTRSCKSDAQKVPLPDDTATRYLAGATLSQLGQSCGASAESVRKHLIAQGVQIRSRANSGECNGMYGRRHDAQAIVKIREANLKQFSDPAARERHALLTCRQIQEGRTGKAFNKFETKVADILRLQGLEFEQQFRLGRFLYDFRICDTNRLIEANGTFWHADPRFYAPDRHSHIQRRNVANDMRKAACAAKHGYALEVMWEFDVG